MTPNLTIKKKEKPTIGSEKAQKLGEALETCDPKYIKTVWDFLSKNNMNRLEDLSIELYDKIYAAALKNQTDYAQGASNAG